MTVAFSSRLKYRISPNLLCIVLKQVHPDTGISNRAMSILNSFVNGKLMSDLRRVVDSDRMT